MASERETRSKTLGKKRAIEAGEEEESEGEEEIEELDAELRDVSRKISDYRKSVPDQLVQAVRSNLAALRPVVLPQIEVSGSTEINTTEAASSENDKRMQEKLSILREKSERNIALILTVQKRMNECVSKLNKVEECRNVNNIHPVFRKR